MNTPPTPAPSQPSAIATEIAKAVRDGLNLAYCEEHGFDHLVGIIDRVLARHSAGAGSKADPFAKAKDDRPAG